MTGSTENSMHGKAHAVVQADNVSGGIHVGASEAYNLPVPRQLPARPWLLAGREAETAVLSEAIMAAGRMDTLPVAAIDGPGGIGKTAFALDWAYRHLEEFPDGQLFADLGGVGGREPPAAPVEVLRGFLTAMGVPASSIPPDVGAASAMFRTRLTGKRVLVVLDNAVDANQVTPILPGAAPAALVVTSRNQLVDLRFGRIHRVRLGALDRAGSVALLAGRINRNAVDADPDAFANLVDHCGGLPLALSIVAARASRHPDFPLSALTDELGDASEDLGGFDAGAESMRLHSVFSWSTSQLAPELARAFRLLGFAPVAQIGRHAASSLLGIPLRRATSLLGELEVRNLLEQPAPHRYQMHELIRRHAKELAEEQDSVKEREAAARRLVDSYVGAAYKADRLLYPYRAQIGPAQSVEHVSVAPLADGASALAWFTAEYKHVLAVQHLAEQCGWWWQVWWTSRLLDTYQHHQALLEDNVDTSRRGVRAAERLNDPLAISLAERQLGRALTHTLQFPDAERHLDRALRAARDQDDLVGQAHTRHDLARLYSLAGRHAASLRHSRAALRLYRDNGDAHGEARARNRMARQFAELGDYETARRETERVLTLHENNGDLAGCAGALDNLGHISQLAGRLDQAVRHFSRALAICAANTDRHFEAIVAEHLGEAYVATGDFCTARTAFDRAQDLYEAQFRDAEARRVSARLRVIQNEPAE
ncbi:hypothetical protein GCM10029992_36860 [Glycomyces albus]